MSNSINLSRKQLVIGKTKLIINSFFCINKLIVKYLVYKKYHSKIVAIHQLYKSQGLFTKQKPELAIVEIKKAIVQQYYLLDYCNRPFVIDILNAATVVKNVDPIISVKKQGRNEICNCGSGSKFKKCCLNKVD